MRLVVRAHLACCGPFLRAPASLTRRNAPNAPEKCQRGCHAPPTSATGPHASVPPLLATGAGMYVGGLTMWAIGKKRQKAILNPMITQGGGGVRGQVSW
jgi:hypothetical protein